MAPSLDELVKQGEGDQNAVELGDGIFMSRNIANSYLVTTADGDLLINAGTDFEAPEIKARLSRVSKGRLRMITFTQGHPDHVGGWSQFTSPVFRRSPRLAIRMSASTGGACIRSTCGGS